MEHYKNYYNEKIVNINTVHISDDDNTKNTNSDYNNKYIRVAKKIEKKINSRCLSDDNTTRGSTPQIKIMSKKNKTKELKNIFNNIQNGSVDSKRSSGRKLEDIKLRKARLQKQVYIDKPHLWISVAEAYEYEASENEDSE